MEIHERTPLRTELKWLAIGLIPYLLIVSAVFIPLALIAWSFRNFTLAGS